MKGAAPRRRCSGGLFPRRTSARGSVDHWASRGIDHWCGGSFETHLELRAAALPVVPAVRRACRAAIGMMQQAAADDSLSFHSPYAFLHYACFFLLLSAVSTTAFHGGVSLFRRLRRKRSLSLRKHALSTRQSLFERLPLFWSPTAAAAQRRHSKVRFCCCSTLFLTTPGQPMLLITALPVSGFLTTRSCCAGSRIAIYF